jgi:hypothetical protein
MTYYSTVRLPAATDTMLFTAPAALNHPKGFTLRVKK